MSIYKFTYNIQKDLENYDYSFFKYKLQDYGEDLESQKKNIVRNLPKTLIKKINDDSKSLEDRADILKKFLESYQKEKKDFIDISMNSVKKLWADRENEYLQRLSEFFGKEIHFKKIDVYFTTLGICPYNWKKNNFYISFWYDLGHQINTICHETMHLMFLHYYLGYCEKKGLNFEQIMNLNEALTVCLNFKFFDLLVTPAQNWKPSTADLQKRIADWCREKKDFEYILENSIKFLKLAE